MRSIQAPFQSQGADLIALLGAETPLIRALAARLVGHLYDHTRPATEALLARLNVETEIGAAASILFALAVLGEESGRAAVVARIPEPGFLGIAAALALVFAQGERADESAAPRLLLGFAEVLGAQCREGWTTCPWADHPMLEEMGEALNAIGVRQEAATTLSDRFDEIVGHDQLGLLWAAIWMGMPDEGGLGPQVIPVLARLVELDALWAIDELPEMLDVFDLPGEREALRELVREHS